MLYPEISAKLSESAFFRGLYPLQNGLKIAGLNQSARALVAADLWYKSGKNLLLISQDDIIAEDLWEDLVCFIGRENAFYLPDYEILPYEERSPHYSIRATRMLTLMAALSDKPAVYSLSIRAFSRLIPNATALSRHVLQLKQGDTIDPEELITKLFNMGYDTQYQVDKVYQAAKRGGILDVFSPTQQNPARIEFWGDEIISIRWFSAGTQRSYSDEVKVLSIIPARELSLDDISSGSVIYPKVREQGFFEGMENYFPLLTQELSTFADYFAADKRIFAFNNYIYVQEELETLSQQIQSQYRKTLKHQSKAKTPPPDKLMLSEAAYYELLSKSQCLYLSQSEYQQGGRDESCYAPTEAQPAFEGDLELLSQRITDEQAQGYTHYLLFDNASQEKRFRQSVGKELRYNSHLGVLHAGFNIKDIRLAFWTDHEIYNRYKRKRYAPRFAPGETIVDYENLKPGDYIVHVDHGIGIFEGLKIIRLDGREVECLVLRYANEDRVYVPSFQLALVSKYVAEEGAAPKLNKLGSTKWQNTKQQAAKEIELIAADLVRLYALRNSRPGLRHKADTEWQEELESSFIYEDTPDQARASAEIKEDMERPVPMERLLCGDVGYGKTEVAIRAAFKAVMGGYQVVVLAPTTLLVEQHFRVFKERYAQYPIRLAMFSRFRSKEMIRRDLEDLKRGNVDIAIGTHRLLSKDVIFKNLGLLIIDEEHRFGVRHKEKLRSLQTRVDTLYMSATPIPRTLNMALVRLKEISLMQSSPKERLPIRTIITHRDMEVIRDAITREIDRGGQVFFVHNRVQTIETVATELRREMPEISFIVGHAQMPENHLEQVMKAFVAKEYQVLISTTIIENGIDIPNANTILIDRADTFGIAQLYQMRGRVGRSNRRAYAYLLIPKGTTEIARKRLEALTQYDYLGAGFQIALRDLELRGAGTILGTKQSGIIQAIGFNYYNRLLGNAIKAVEEGKPISLFEDEVKLGNQSTRTELDLYLPLEYIASDEERLRIYRRLGELTTIEELMDFEAELKDRFGELPENARWLLLFFKIDLLSKAKNLKNCTVKKGIMSLEYSAQHTPPKEEILRLSSLIDEPMRFEMGKGLKIIIELDKEMELLGQFERAIEILGL